MRERIKSIITGFPKIHRFSRGLHRKALAVRSFANNSKTLSRMKKDDMFLCSKLAELSEVKFIQIGSNDGITGDPIYNYIVHDLWEGILVEPVPAIFSKLCDLHYGNVRVRLVNAAIAPKGEELTFYTVDPKANEKLGNTLPEWWDQLSSFKRENITKHLNGVLEPFIVEINVETITLDELIVRYAFEEFNLLHIDAEGFDFEVISTLNLEIYRPKIIIVEHKHMKTENLRVLRTRLMSLDYKLWELHSDLLCMR